MLESLSLSYYCKVFRDFWEWLSDHVLPFMSGEMTLHDFSSMRGSEILQMKFEVQSNLNK